MYAYSIRYIYFNVLIYIYVCVCMYVLGAWSDFPFLSPADHMPAEGGAS